MSATYDAKLHRLLLHNHSQVDIEDNSIVPLSSTAITPEAGAIYTKTLAEGDDFSIDTAALSSNRQLTFELHLTQPATPVSFTLPTTLVWAIGDEFTLTAAPPAMSTGGKTYALVIRWDGNNLLANLAYTKAVFA